MPKKPTLKARKAQERLLGLVTEYGGKGLVLPPTRILAERFGVHHTTIYRLLDGMSGEGVVWQHPSGRFYPGSMRKSAAQGLPLVVVGRSMQEWSALYLEIFEGVSARCASLGSPVVLISSESLLQHPSPDSPPDIADEKQQRAEAKRILKLIPKACGALLFDHLWNDNLIPEFGPSNVPRGMLMRNSGPAGVLRFAPDFEEGAAMAVQWLLTEQIGTVIFAHPFAGDASVAECANAFLQAGQNLFPGRIIEFDASTLRERGKLVNKVKKSRGKICVICPEDNVARKLKEQLQRLKTSGGNNAKVLSLQGSAAGVPPCLRYDYRMLGHHAATALLGGKDMAFSSLPAPTFQQSIPCQTDAKSE